MSDHLCPSARCEPGAILLGAVKDDGIVRMLPMKLIMDEEDVEIAKKKAKPETYLRFANTCITNNCKQWKNQRCTVYDQVKPFLESKNLSCQPKKCSIRDACRWFSQDGLQACRLCPLVLTE